MLHPVMQHSLTLPPQATWQATAATVLQHLLLSNNKIIYVFIYILKNINYLHYLHGPHGPIGKQIIYTLSKKKIIKGPITQMALCLQKKIVGHSERKRKKNGLLKYCNACAAICTYLHDHALSMFTRFYAFLNKQTNKKRANILSA